MISLKVSLDFISFPLSAQDQLLAAVAYLHAHRVVHRGITADNLVVSSENLKERFQLVIADLYSTARSVEQGVCLTEVIGSPEYWALELAQCEYSYPADVWAAGVVLWFAQTKQLGLFLSLLKSLKSLISFNVF